MNYAVLAMAVLLPLLMGAAFLLGRVLHRRQYLHDGLSPVTRQHIELFRGGQLSEAAVEAAKSRLSALLERGEVAAVEAGLRPGMGYVVQVRALAEIGTDEARRILERQLQRRLTRDPLEQSWYWIDLASGLRAMNRQQSLPHLLRCSEAAGDAPLGHFFAAETVCFLGFGGYLRQADGPLGRAALGVLRRALEGLGHGVQPHVVVEARLGEVIEGLWDERPEGVCPLVVRVFAEALRVLRRAPHAEQAFDDDPDREAFRMQVSRLAAVAPMLEDYLAEAPQTLCAALARTPAADHPELLQALTDLRAEAAPAVLPFLGDPAYRHAEQAVTLLAWSRQPGVGRWLCDWALAHVPAVARAQRRRRSVPPRHPSVPDDFPYDAVLHALRRHPSREVEAFLLVAARDWDPTYRAAAARSLGWWEPFDRDATRATLQRLRRDPAPEVRQAARAALARLGERQALQGFRYALGSQDPLRAHEAIHRVETEGLTLLWPDLDRLADADDPDLAHHAREALAHLAEELDARAG